MAPQILFFFFLMLLVGGVAIDFMRFETKRVALQNTMDRATLAAASLEQTLVPVDVVNDWFDKAGLEEDLDSVTIDEGTNYRIVQAKATTKSKNFFMSMMDIPYLESQNRSQAEQRINDIEIMLVLDVSGSMASNSKIQNLKIAAHDFIDTVTANDPEGRISIGIIPYNAQVNLGNTLAAKYTASYNHGVSNAKCFELPSGVFNSLALSRSTAFPMMAVADTQGGTNQFNQYVALTDTDYATPGNTAARRWCNPSTKIDVTLPTKNKTSLHSAIDDLVAEGNTSILLGMRWATALLDPGAQSLYTSLINDGAMASNMSGRPFTYDSNEAMKVVVLMTDGEHVAHGRVVDAYKTGTSPIWRANDAYLSIFHSSKVNNSTSTTICNSRPFYVPHLNAWHSRPWNGTTPNATACYSPTATYTNTTRQSWEQVWARARVSWVAWQLYARALGTTNTTRTNTYNAQMAAMIQTYQSVSSMNSLLSSNCSKARDEGILIYGIAFEAPSNGKTAISDCASKPGSTYFFDANGLEIQTAFQLIAANLSQLRLTQ